MIAWRGPNLASILRIPVRERRSRAEFDEVRHVPPNLAVPGCAQRAQLTRGSTALVAAATGDKHGIVTVYTPPDRRAKEAVDPESLFRTGLELLKREERVFEGVTALERAWRLRPLEARYTSYYGLSLALSRERLNDAEALCVHAVNLDSRLPDLFYNLGKVRLLRKDRKGAYSAFKRGLSVDRGNARIKEELAKLGKRRPPVVPFLRRRHPLNKFFGIIFSRIATWRARSK